VIPSKKSGRIDNDALEPENEARNGTISPIPSISNPMPISIRKNKRDNCFLSPSFNIFQISLVIFISETCVYFALTNKRY
jgi:hypothetical protein